MKLENNEAPLVAAVVLALCCVVDTHPLLNKRERVLLYQLENGLKTLPTFQLECSGLLQGEEQEENGEWQ